MSNNLMECKKDSKPVRSIKKIYFSEITFFTGQKMLEVDFYKKGTCKVDLACGFTSIGFNKRFNKEITKRIISKIEEIKMESWKETYEFENVVILDGTTWNLEIEYQDGFIKKSSGNGVFPRNYKKLIRLIEDLDMIICREKEFNEDDIIAYDMLK